MKRVATMVLGIGIGALVLTGCGGTPADKVDQNTTQDQNTSVTNCKVSGDTVMAPEGKTCTDPGDNKTKVKCENDKVTVNDSLTGKTVTINGRTYTCE